MDILSTKAVAEMLDVSEATVKRWSDAGTLRCFRTPGGHRKFRLRDVKSFLSDMHGDGDVPVAGPPPSPELTPEQKEARRLALDADVDGLVSLVASQRIRGTSLATTFDRIFTPALHDIGSCWAAGKLLITQEHIASNAIGEMLARVRPLVGRSRESRGRALCACVADEQHDLAIRMASLVLGAEGFDATVVGSNVPAHDLALLVAGERPALLVLSASESVRADRVREELAVIADAARSVRTPIIAGGRAFDELPSLPVAIRRCRTFEELVLAALLPAPRASVPARSSLTDGAPDLS